MTQDDRTLRTSLIKLAAANPNGIREKILPLLKEAGSERVAARVRKLDPFGSDPSTNAQEKLPRYMGEVKRNATVLAQSIRAAETVAKTAGVTDPFFAKATKAAEDISADVANVTLTPKK